jgi:hypothetical protein
LRGDGKGGIDPSALAYFADAPMALAVVSTIERDLSMRSIVLRLSYPPAGSLGMGDVVASARLSSVSENAGNAAIAIRDGNGHALATGSLEGLVVTARHGRDQPEDSTFGPEPPPFVEWRAARRTLPFGICWELSLGQTTLSSFPPTPGCPPMPA